VRGELAPLGAKASCTGKLGGARAASAFASAAAKAARAASAAASPCEAAATTAPLSSWTASSHEAA
jgi:hypothetical protein